MSAVSHRLDLNPSDFPRHQERNARQRQRLSPLPAQPEDVVQSSQGGVQLNSWTGLCRKSQALSILHGTE